MKISIARLKEIIMEEVARATATGSGRRSIPGLGDTIASPFIKLLDALLPQDQQPEDKKKMLRRLD